MSETKNEKKLTWIAADSSQLQLFAYEPADKQLFIQFNTGATYRYDNVPPEIFDNLQRAESQGKYFNANIKGKFPTTRLP